MPMNRNLVASKLSELDTAYTQMISKIKLCHKGTYEEIIQAQKELWDECMEQEAQLEKVIASGRSQAVTELSAMQLHYFRETRGVLEEKLPQYLDAMSRPTDSSRVEAMALYAEFAIDSAIQSMRYALHAAFSAVELQMSAAKADAVSP